MTMKNWNNEQIKEALGEVNRYYFGLANKRSPKEGREGEVELILYYIDNGGAEGFRKRNNQGIL